MLKLSKDTKYITELQEFQSQINRILVQKNKHYAQNLLNKIVNQANLIDEGHASNNDGNIQTFRRWLWSHNRYDSSVGFQ